MRYINLLTYLLTISAPQPDRHRLIVVAPFGAVARPAALDGDRNTAGERAGGGQEEAGLPSERERVCIAVDCGQDVRTRASTTFVRGGAAFCALERPATTTIVDRSLARWSRRPSFQRAAGKYRRLLVIRRRRRRRRRRRCRAADARHVGGAQHATNARDKCYTRAAARARSVRDDNPYIPPRSRAVTSIEIPPRETAPRYIAVFSGRRPTRRLARSRRRIVCSAKRAQYVVLLRSVICCKLECRQLSCQCQ